MEFMLLALCAEKIMTLQDEWEDYYRSNADRQSQQNSQLSYDFLASLPEYPVIHNAFLSSRRIIGLGCGTGELCASMAKTFGILVTGVDICTTAIRLAQAHFGQECEFINVSFDDPSLSGKYDLAISSNVLEHFKDWPAVLKTWLAIAPKVIILTPYREAHPKGSNGFDGGLGHVVSFDETSFADFHLVDWFIFQSEGWWVGKDPYQLVALIEATHENA